MSASSNARYPIRSTIAAFTLSPTDGGGWRDSNGTIGRVPTTVVDLRANFSRAFGFIPQSTEVRHRLGPRHLTGVREEVPLKSGPPTPGREDISDPSATTLDSMSFGSGGLQRAELQGNAPALEVISSTFAALTLSRSFDRRPVWSHRSAAWRARGHPARYPIGQPLLQTTPARQYATNSYSDYCTRERRANPIALRRGRRLSPNPSWHWPPKTQDNLPPNPSEPEIWTTRLRSFVAHMSVAIGLYISSLVLAL